MPAHRSPRWTQAEIAVLEEFYPELGVDCVEHLPGRSWRAVHQKAFKLGLRCEKVTPAPEGKLEGEDLDEAIRLREEQGWSFARIGAKFGLCEASASNCVLIALCPRKGYRPAERDETGRLLPAGIERLRYALKLGLKGVDIQLRLGLSAGRIALERRRYNAELKARGKAPLPPPGRGEAYSGVKVSAAMKREAEALFTQGLGTLKVSQRTGVSKTSCTRIRNRLVARLKRQGRTLSGCDSTGRRHTQAESARFVTPEQVDLFRAQLLERVPVRRAARDCVIGLSTGYRLRDQLDAELAARGDALPDPKLPGRTTGAKDPFWPPEGAKRIYAFRALLADMPFAQARAQWRRLRSLEQVGADTEPTPFQRQLARVARGEATLAANFTARRHLEPAFTPEHVDR